MTEGKTLNLSRAVAAGKRGGSSNYQLSIDVDAFNAWLEADATNGVCNQEAQILAHLESVGYACKVSDLAGIELRRQDGRLCSQDMETVFKHYKQKWVERGYLTIDQPRKAAK